MKFSSRPAEIKPALKRSILALSLAAGLGACGGGDGNGNGNGGGQPRQDANSVPASAAASVPAFVNYLNTTAENETGEPLDVGITPPTSDTDEPIEV